MLLELPRYAKHASVLLGGSVSERKPLALPTANLSDAPAYELSKRVATRFFSRCEEGIDVVVLPAHGATPEQQAFLDSVKGVDLA